MAEKEAVVFILDANLTMNAPYPLGDRNNEGAAEVRDWGDESNGDSRQSTRLSQAKDAMLGSIIDYMWHSKTHEAGVVVLKAGVTHHHLSEIERIVDDDDLGKFFRRCGGGVKLDRYKCDGDGNDSDDDDVFPNLVEFDLNRPTPHTLRAIKNVQCTINASISSNIRGDLCDGLILAADTLHRRTNGKKYKRKIVMFTDAEHEVEVNGEQLQCVLDGLGNMDVQLIVVGIGFEAKEGVTIPIKDSDSDDDSDKTPDVVMSGIKEDKTDSLIKEEDQNGMMIKEEGNPDEIMSDCKLDNDIRQLIKRENQKLLLSIIEETKGCMIAANGVNLTELLQTKLPCLAGTKKSMRKKSEFRIAPKLTVDAKLSKLTDKMNLPTTIKEAYQFGNVTGEKLRDGNGELMTTPTRTLTEHFDDDDNTIQLDKRTDAYSYGSDLIPVGKMDMLGINAAFSGPESIEVIGYIDRSVVLSSSLLMGPAYAYTGGDSKKSRTAIAALSQALEETEKVAFCRFVKMKNGDPRIGALLPKLAECDGDDAGRDDGNFGPDTRGKGGRYLVLLELPFADDVQHHANRSIPLESRGDYNDEKVCDNLIDSMMLPDEDFQFEDISFPALKSYHQMVAHFAMNPMSPEEEMKEGGLAEERVLETSQAKPLCELDVLRGISNRAAKQINAFVENFPLVENKPEDEKKPRYWGDGLRK